MLKAYRTPVSPLSCTVKGFSQGNLKHQFLRRVMLVALFATKGTAGHLQYRQAQIKHSPRNGKIRTAFRKLSVNQHGVRMGLDLLFFTLLAPCFAMS